MKIKRNFASVLFIALLVYISFIPVTAAAGDNIALNAVVESCSYTKESEKDIFLTDSDPGYNTSWTAADGDKHINDGTYHWITLDFGSDKTFNRIKLVKASEGSQHFGQIQYDASAFYFEVSSDKINWRNILDVVGNEESPIFESAFSPVTARYLKLTITAPEADPDNHFGAARLYDLKVFETAGDTKRAGEAKEFAALENIDYEPEIEISDNTVPASAPRSGDNCAVMIFALASAAVFGIALSRRKNGVML